MEGGRESGRVEERREGEEARERGKEGREREGLCCTAIIGYETHKPAHTPVHSHLYTHTLMLTHLHTHTHTHTHTYTLTLHMHTPVRSHITLTHLASLPGA